MDCTISEAGLKDLPGLWQESRDTIDWPHPFILPAWLQAWWEIFGEGSRPCIRVARDGRDVIGIAPLMEKENAIYFIGDTDVCDYQDFPVKAGREEDFFSTLLDNLAAGGADTLELKHVREESTVMKMLAGLAGERGLTVETEQEAVSAEMTLPGSYDEYLASLTTKQRHEVRRKLRRLGEAGKIDFRLDHEGRNVPDALEALFRMFVESRRDKARFMTGRIKEFFRSLAAGLDGIGILRLGVLELDGYPVASVMGFDYRQRRYLYNCGYDPDYASLNAGLASKVLAIRDGIENGLKEFDFLKGDESYKHHLGGTKVPLYRCTIRLS